MFKASYVYSKQDFQQAVNARARIAGSAGLLGLLKRLGVMICLLIFGGLIGAFASGGWQEFADGSFLQVFRDVGPYLVGLAIAWTLLARYVIQPWAVSGWYFPRLAIANQPLNYELLDDGIHYASPTATGVISWPGVHRVVDMPGAIVVFISQIEGLVLPERAFATTSDFATARQFIRDKTGGK